MTHMNDHLQEWSGERLDPWADRLYVRGFQVYLDAARADPDGLPALDALRTSAHADLRRLETDLGTGTLTDRAVWRWEKRFMDGGPDVMDALTARHPEAAAALNLIQQREVHRRLRLIQAASDALT
ncbi:hypothetical protein [Deinococcus soli (ex Cha et al. 2016)]|uniref:Uncharacterized protein n=2 Tax=Deinococcus soli (ex Cha et al. 2016) TaxID=1309411 RepID=A0AAE3XD67_9DEIO|nr:hypothetical protein [Deinococcus soli (ex Cha et al. 2016)]MDR6218738.1 hypothetical protein [Deinococcus soli (ex Cha et al. 2016)]MDR6328535.1 hypothetical protein [Deinococcus soli (ex Cha et al. 2016)]MDR6753146.1 hypothetical protein [Deinococcus soli (ex Cha et al. 2016)]